MNDIKTMLDIYASEITKAIEKYLERNDPDFQNLIESMRYSAILGGKRIRPFLVLAFADCLGGKREAAMPYACAVEMMHCYSLIHDDLPAMDDDDLRRGSPTNHKVYGEATAILAGDALFTSAIEAAATNEYLNADNRIAAIKLLTTCSGAYGMIGGQQIDLGVPKILSFDKLIKMHSLKTGALIKCSGLLGTLAAGKYTDERIRTACTNYCINIGLAFQIIDDIIDATETPEISGKSTSDERNNKVTFLSYMTVEGAYDCAAKLTEQACAAVRDFDINGVLCDLARFLLTRKK